MSASDDLDRLLERIPYARFLGLRPVLAGDEMTLVMPYRDHLIGNPSLPALHGGVLGALMEMTAVVQIGLVKSLDRLPKPVDVTVEYLRSGRPLDTYARAEVKRAGRRIANVWVEAWQESRSAPIASLHGHFMLPAQTEPESEPT